MRVMFKDDKDSEIYDVVQVELDRGDAWGEWFFLIMDDKGVMSTYPYVDLVILRGDK